MECKLFNDFPCVIKYVANFGEFLWYMRFSNYMNGKSQSIVYDRWKWKIATLGIDYSSPGFDKMLTNISLLIYSRNILYQKIHSL